MIYFQSSRFPIWLCVYLTLVIITIDADEDRFPREIPDYRRLNHIFRDKPIIELPTTVPFDRKECYMTCSGPVAHYKSLSCSPVYGANKCCPVRYICYQDNPDKCYVNGYEYNVGERIRQEDALLCEADCICRKGDEGPADFQCTSREELCPFYTPSDINCYQRSSLQQCCPEEYCPEAGVRHVCNVNGNEYLDGQYVVLKNRPDLICICRANNTDEGLVCVKSGRWFWSDIHASIGFYKNCAPVYLPYKRNIGIHRQTWRCQNINDRVFCSNESLSAQEHQIIHRSETAVPANLMDACDKVSAYHQDILLGTPRATRNRLYYWKCQLLLWYKHQCIFGRIRMHIGDRLNNVKYGNNSCILCTCEIPPVPTCVLKSNTFC